MTTEKMRDLFNEFSEGFGDKCEFLKFDRIRAPAHHRPDVCAFVMLDLALDRNPHRSSHGRDMVSAATHDEIFLDVDAEALAAVATEDLIRDLSRCGVRYSREYDCLAMFV